MDKQLEKEGKKEKRDGDREKEEICKIIWMKKEKREGEKNDGEKERRRTLFQGTPERIL